jgi:peptidoglycan hydrolase-like protein with peptidoglycan-binding domain
MYRLSASVGQNGVNKHDDVLIVQGLLNKNAHIVESIGRVPEDGNFDPSTGRAIIAFQHDVVRIASPDGRVDPNGRTYRILTGDVPHGATVAFVQLPGSGNGYYLYSNQDKQWGTPSTIQSIQTVAESLLAAGITIGVGDISYANGGRMPPHASHRRGIDVDIRPQRTDGTRVPVQIRDANYSQENTKKIVEELHKDENLSFIFFNDKKIDGVRFWAGHDNHLHVRFKQ